MSEPAARLQAHLDRTGWALLLILALLWSSSFIFMKVAGAEIPVLTLVLLRVGIAAIVLHLFVVASGRRYPRGRGELLRFALMGLVNNVLPFALIIYAIARIGAGAASILNATSPIFALLIAHVATANEKITPRKLSGVLLGLGGVAAMVGPQALAGLESEVVAAAAMALASLFYGFSAVLGRSFRSIDPVVSATCQLTAATLMLTPVALAFDRPWKDTLPGIAASTSVLGLAVFSTAIAYVVFYALIRHAGSTNTILVTLLIPVGGVIFSWLLLDEIFTVQEACGMALIGLGLIVIDGRLAARLRRPAIARRAAAVRRE